MALPPCPRCLALALAGEIRMETVQPLPEGALAPLASDGSGKCCPDCAAADTLLRMKAAPGFTAARVSVGNDRQEALRLPMVPLGLVRAGIMRPSKSGDLEIHWAWLNAHEWFEPEHAADCGCQDCNDGGENFTEPQYASPPKEQVKAAAVRLVNRYAVQAVAPDDGRRAWIVWDRQRQAAVEDRDTRAAAREAMKDYRQERIEMKEGDVL